MTVNRNAANKNKMYRPDTIALLVCTLALIWFLKPMMGLADNNDFFLQRHVIVTLSEKSRSLLGETVNSVLVTIRKKHADGSETIKEVSLAGKSVKAGFESVVYGNKRDKDKHAWTQYEYRVNWSFRGGSSYTSDWLKSRDDTLRLSSPAYLRNITLTGDLSAPKNLKVRSISVVVVVPFFGKTQKARVGVKRGENLAKKSLQLLCPLEQKSYEYEITWFLDGGGKKTSRGRSTSDAIAVDRLN